MSKIFVHHPLKRAELKRIYAPPPPPPISAKVRLPEPDFEEKARRAKERADARKLRLIEEEKDRLRVEKLGQCFIIARVENFDFGLWMSKRFNQEQVFEEFGHGEKCSLLMSLCLPDPGRKCLQCKRVMNGHIGVNDHALSCIVVLTTVKGIKPKEVLLFSLCERCKRINDKALRLLAGRRMIEELDGEIVALVGKSHVHSIDVEYLTEISLPKLKLTPKQFDHFVERLEVASEDWYAHEYT